MSVLISLLERKASLEKDRSCVLDKYYEIKKKMDEQFHEQLMVTISAHLSKKQNMEKQFHNEFKQNISEIDNLLQNIQEQITATYIESINNSTCSKSISTTSLNQPTTVTIKVEETDNNNNNNNNNKTPTLSKIPRLEKNDNSFDIDTHMNHNNTHNKSAKEKHNNFGNVRVTHIKFKDLTSKSKRENTKLKKVSVDKKPVFKKEQNIANSQRRGKKRKLTLDNPSSGDTKRFIRMNSVRTNNVRRKSTTSVSSLHALFCG